MGPALMEWQSLAPSRAWSRVRLYAGSVDVAATTSFCYSCRLQLRMFLVTLALAAEISNQYEGFPVQLFKQPNHNIPALPTVDHMNCTDLDCLKGPCATLASFVCGNSHNPFVLRLHLFSVSASF